MRMENHRNLGLGMPYASSGAQDAPKYRCLILPLVFTKRLCDEFDDELNRIAERVGSRAKAVELVERDGGSGARGTTAGCIRL